MSRKNLKFPRALWRGGKKKLRRGRREPVRRIVQCSPIPIIARAAIQLLYSQILCARSLVCEFPCVCGK